MRPEKQKAEGRRDYSWRMGCEEGNSVGRTSKQFGILKRQVRARVPKMRKGIRLEKKPLKKSVGMRP